MKYLADTVTAVFTHHRVSLALRISLDCVAYVAKAHTRPDHVSDMGGDSGVGLQDSLDHVDSGGVPEIQVVLGINT